MAEFKTEAGKELEHLTMPKRKLLKNYRNMSKWPKNQLEGTPIGQVWNKVRIKISY